MGDRITRCNVKLVKPPVDHNQFSKAEVAVSMAA